MPLVLSAGAILLLVLVVVILNSQSGGDDGGEAPAPAEQRQPAAPSRSAPQATELKMGSATSGKTPDRPAPTLTNEMLQKANAMIDEVKALNNEGTRLRNAGEKLERKNLDFIVANDVSSPEVGMDSDDNAVTILARDGRSWEVPRAPKPQIAEAILDHIIAPSDGEARVES